MSWGASRLWAMMLVELSFLLAASALITESYLERDGDRVLLRLAIHRSAVLDVLTDDGTLARARAWLSAPETPQRADLPLGTFGPFPVTLSVVADRAVVSLMIDGPELGPAFRGDQGAGLYLERADLLAALSRSAG